jgi:hypothetical protein
MMCNDAITYVDLLLPEEPMYDPASKIGAGLLVTAEELCEVCGKFIHVMVFPVILRKGGKRRMRGKGGESQR